MLLGDLNNAILTKIYKGVLFIWRYKVNVEYKTD